MNANGPGNTLPMLLRALLPGLGYMLEERAQRAMVELVPWAGHMV